MSDHLPSGTVTLVLGDVEASTQHWETSADSMAAAMKSLGATVDELVAVHRGGRPLEQGEGDSFVTAFARASDAIGFALDLQLRLRANDLRLHVGAHTGEVELDARSYAGSTIIRAARLRDAGHGGQILVSQTTADLVRDVLHSDVSFQDLGEHHLKGLTRPERVWQLCHPDLLADFPALRVAGDAPTLPLPLTSFVGRGLELIEVRDLIKESGCITLTGAGGAGKTRLAIELVAERLAVHQPSWFVDLAAVDRYENVASAVADAVGARVTPGRLLSDAVAAAVNDQAGLLVLDNCEHVLATCSTLAADLLARARDLVVLATSREPLGISGEVTYRLPSLSEQEAAELFVERARRADPRFTPDTSNAATVAEICARLDGMPLAIELAAARMRVFSAAQLLDALHDRFRLLTGGARTALPRQRTLEASVDWSHTLLLEPERALLRRLSVFAGGFTVEAAVAVASDGELAPHHVLDLLVQLVDKSLVATDDQSPGRFRILETIRHYASARLVDWGESDDCRRRHYDYFLGAADPRPRGEEHARVVFTADEANIRRALQYAADLPGYDELLALADNVAPHWFSRRAEEGVGWFTILDERTQDQPAAVRAQVRSRLAQLKTQMGDFMTAGELALSGIALARESGEDRVLMRCILEAHLAMANAFAPDPELLDEAYTIAAALGDERALSFAIGLRGFHLMREGDDLAGSQALLLEALDLAQTHGLSWWTALLEGFLAMRDLLGGVGAGALVRADRAAALLRESDAYSVLCNLLALSAPLRASLGDDAAAECDLAELDEMVSGAGGLLAMYQLLGHGLVDLVRGNFDAAAEFLGPLASIRGGDGFLTVPIALLAVAEAAAGRHDDAERHARWAIGTGFDIGGIVSLAAATALCEIALHGGDYERGFEIILEQLSTTDAEVPIFTPVSLGMLGHACFGLGRNEEAARIMAAGQNLSDNRGNAPLPGIWEQLVGDAQAQCRAALGTEKYDALADEGRGLSSAQAVALVMRGRGSRLRPMLGWDSLTPTEAEVARLVSQGETNKAVAAQLFMSEATVKTHLTRIYAKVGVQNRAQLAAHAR